MLQVPLCFWQTLASILSVCIIPTSSLLSWESSRISLPSHLSLTASATINEETIYLFGGYIDDTNLPSDKIYKFNNKDGFWITLPITIPSLPLYCYQCTAIINQTLIYIVTQHTNTIYIFDTTTDTFLSSNTISPPLFPINGSYISVTNDLLGQYMFVISYQQSGPHSIPYLQRYNSYTNQWLQSRQFPFPSHGYTSSIYYNNILFVFAGHTKHCDDITNQCAIDTHNRICGYNITIHKWTCYKSTLNENKYAASIIMNHLHNKIYIIAGWNNQNQYSNTIDIFDPNTFICSPIQSLPNIGGLVLTSILNNQLIVFGGRNLSSSSINPIYSSLVLRNVSQKTTFPPSNNPSANPSANPSIFPSVNPTHRPTHIPSITPTVMPSILPTIYPSHNPSIFPSNIPTKYPTYIPSFFSLTPSVSPIYNPTKYPSITPTLQPTNNPSLLPSKYPTNIPSFMPTINPSDTPIKHITNPPSPSPIKRNIYTPTITHTNEKHNTQSPISLPYTTRAHKPTQIPLSYTSQSPTSILTSHPTTLPKSTHIKEIKTTHIINYANITPQNTLSDHYDKLLISSITALIIFMLCCIYLCVFTSKRTLEIGQMEWIDFVKYPSYLLKIGLIMEITDIFSDFMYSIYLINNNASNVYTVHSIETLAWISFICGIIGSLLFVFECLLARKLYAKIPMLHEKLKQSSKRETDELIASTDDIIHEIRIRKVDVDIFAILISCFQDIPQITIIIIATCILSEWTQFSVLSLMLSIASCTLKLLKVMVDFFGCGDDVIEIFGYKDGYNYWNKNTVSININNNPKQTDAKYMKNIKFEKIANASGTDDIDCEYETEESIDDDTSSIMSDDSMKTHYRMGLMDDSDSDENDDEYDLEDGVIETNINCKQNNSNNNNKRQLRISRKCTFKKHKLLRIPEEINESWSEFDFDIK